MKALRHPVGITAILFAATLTLFSYAASANSLTKDSHLTSVLKSRTLRVAVQCQAAPWGIMEPSGKHEGYDIDIANALGKALGAKVAFTCTTNAARIPDLQANKVDVVIASFTATNTRAQQVAFSIPYAISGTLIAVQKNSPIKDYADLVGKTVSASRGSIGATILERDFPKAHLQLFQDFADSVQAVLSKKVDALIENNVIVPQLVKRDPKLRVLAGPVLEPAFFSFGIAQGDPVWMNYLDNFIRNYLNSSEASASWAKWVGGPLPAYLKSNA